MEGRLSSVGQSIYICHEYMLVLLLGVCADRHKMLVECLMLIGTYLKYTHLKVGDLLSSWVKQESHEPASDGLM